VLSPAPKRVTFAVCKDEEDDDDLSSYISAGSLSDSDEDEDDEFRLCDQETARYLFEILLKMQKVGLPLPIAPATAFVLTAGQVHQTLKYLSATNNQ